MLGGLVHQTDDGPQVTAAYTAAGSQFGGNSQAPAATASTAAETTASVTSTAGEQPVTGEVNSHLDSFFQSHALTREDVLVLAAFVQLLAWAALLYLEVNE